MTNPASRFWEMWMRARRHPDAHVIFLGMTPHPYIWRAISPCTSLGCLLTFKWDIETMWCFVEHEPPKRNGKRPYSEAMRVLDPGYIARYTYLTMTHQERTESMAEALLAWFDWLHGHEHIKECEDCMADYLKGDYECPTSPWLKPVPVAYLQRASATSSRYPTPQCGEENPASTSSERTIKDVSGGSKSKPFDLSSVRRASELI